MIPSRFVRLLGAALLLVPSLAFGQSALQQPATTGAADPIPVALSKLYQNDLFLQTLISTRISQLGAAAFLNVGTVTGTVADGGALAAEAVRAQAAESGNSVAIANEITRAKASEAALQAAIGAATNAYAVNYTAQSLTAPQQLQARQNIAALASGDVMVLGSGSTATTPAAGDNTTKVATTAFSTGALSSYASTVASTYQTQSAAASTYAPLSTVNAALGNRLRLDASGGYSSPQIAQGLSNLGIDATETSVGSAATTDIGSVSTQFVAVTGTTAITSFGTAASRVRYIRFTGSTTLTYNATSLILPGAVNILTQPGDTCIATSDANGNWTVRAYVPAAGFGGQGRTIASGAGASSGTLNNASASIRWVPAGQKLIFFTAKITITDNGTGSGASLLTLPFAPSADVVFAGRETAVGGKMLQARAVAGNPTISIFNYDNSYPASNGAVLIVSGTYEAQ